MKKCMNPTCNNHKYKIDFLDIQNYCFECGEKLTDITIVCPCGHSMMLDMNYCTNCGLDRKSIGKETAEQNHLETEENRVTGN